MAAEPVYFNFTRDIVERWARERPKATALWWINENGSKQKKISFSQLGKDSRRAAHVWHSLGIQRGDRVLVILPRVPQWWIAILGLIRLGAVPIPGTPLLTAKDMAYRVQAADVSALITDEEGAAKAVDLPVPHRILVDENIAGWMSFDAALREANPSFDPEPTHGCDPGIIYFTSGTTGLPKMVLHSQASYGLGHRLTGELWLDLSRKDVHWCLTDTGWAKAAWSCLFGPWHTGACVFVHDARGRFDAAATLRILAKFPITSWCAPPTALRLIAGEDLTSYRFPRLRHCVSAGEPLNPEVITTWKKAIGLTFYEGYGQTETVAIIANIRSRRRKIRPGSMGHPLPGFEIALLDANLNELPAGHDGEIAIRVKPRRPLGLFREYWRNPEENSRRFRGDWYLTGDIARRDRDGYFWFVGRADDVIKSAAYRIGPFEVESALIEHPAVVEAAVIGKADVVRGQIVKAFVVLRKEYRPSDDLKRILQEHCKKITAPYKYPRQIEFVTELPKTVSGKIRRLELRKRS